MGFVKQSAKFSSVHTHFLALSDLPHLCAILDTEEIRRDAVWYAGIGSDELVSNLLSMINAGFDVGQEPYLKGLLTTIRSHLLQVILLLRMAPDSLMEPLLGGAGYIRMFGR